MNLRCTKSALLAIAILGTAPAIAQHPASGAAPRRVDLNEFTFNGSGLKKMRKRVRVDDAMVHFPVVEAGNPKPWDSSYWMTGFPAPTDKKFILASVDGRVADFDTGKFRLCLAVLQINGSDTMFREVPITLAPDEKRPKHWHLMPLRDSGIVLQPAPFFLGYGFHVKPVTEAFKYRIYAAYSGSGEGTMMHIRNGVRNLMTSPGHAVFPFKISYLEL